MHRPLLRVLQRILPLTAGAAVLGLSTFFAFSQPNVAHADLPTCEEEILTQSGEWLNVQAAMASESSYGAIHSANIHTLSGAMAATRAKLAQILAAQASSSSVSSLVVEYNTLMHAQSTAMNASTGSVTALSLSGSGTLEALQVYMPLALDAYSCLDPEGTVTASGSMPELVEPTYESLPSGTTCSILQERLRIAKENSEKAKQYMEEVWKWYARIQGRITLTRNELRHLEALRSYLVTHQPSQWTEEVAAQWLDDYHSSLSNLEGYQNMSAWLLEEWNRASDAFHNRLREEKAADDAVKNKGMFPSRLVLHNRPPRGRLGE